MERERNILVRDVFPELRKRLRARGVELFEVDLRWGVTEQQIQNGQMLPTLLAEVERCRPFFVALLGERYGWVPDPSALTDDLKAAYPAIADAEGRSVTELEIIQGLLARPDGAANVIVMDRDPAWVAGLSEIERGDFLENGAESRARLADLRARVRASGATVLPYAGPEAIGPALKAALGAALDARFPDAEASDPYARTARLHAAYARRRRRLHVGGDYYVSRLDEWMAEEKPTSEPMVILGDPGCGKSTLVANWVETWRRAHPDDIVFEHYLGASSEAANPLAMMRRLWDHLDRATGAAVEAPGGAVGVADFSNALQRRLAEADASLGDTARILVALDGLDRLANEPSPTWLPTVLPRRTRLLLATNDREGARDRLWTELWLRPLHFTDRQKALDGALAGLGRRLAPEHEKRILDHPLAQSPLFLTALLDELRYSATHERLSERLDYYLSAQSMPELFARILKRLEDDLGDGDFVGRALALLWASRAGLEETEILAITGATPLAWSRLRASLGDALSDQDGRVAFTHEAFRQAVEAEFLGSQDARVSAHLAIADRFSALAADAYRADELAYQLRRAQAWDRLEALLLDLDRFEPLLARGESELLGHWRPLIERGRDVEALLCAVLTRRIGKAKDWSAADSDLASSVSGFLDFAGARGEGSLALAEDVSAAAARIHGPDHPDALWARSWLAEALLDRGSFSDARAIHEDLLRTTERTLGKSHPDTLARMDRLATCHDAAGRYREAQALRERALKLSIRLRGKDNPDTDLLKANLAGTLRSRGALGRALWLQIQVLEAARRRHGGMHPETLTADSNLGGTLFERGHAEVAQEHHERVLAGRMAVLGPNHPDTLSAMSNLAGTLSELGQNERSSDLEQRILDARTALLGPDHPDTLTTLNNLGLSLSRLGRRDEGLALLARALDGMTAALGPDHPSTKTVARSYAFVEKARKKDARKRMGRARPT